MKKFLWIVIQGLLLSGTVLAREIKPLNKSGFIFNDSKNGRKK
jgi:hypothetical protein